MHDYDPAWDYELATPDTEGQALLAVAEQDARERLLPALGFADFEVFCVVEHGFGEGTLARYVDGTSSRPMVGIDLAALRASCADYSLDLGQQLRATLAHELAHAYEETLGHSAHDEDASERFARCYVEEGIVDATILHDPPRRRARRR